MATNSKMRVVVRVRPFNQREIEHNARNIVKILDKSTLIFDPDVDEDEFFFHGMKQEYRDITKRVKKNLTMEYDDVFDNTSANADIFEVCMKPLVQSVMDGYNCSVFVYGATGAGKTHTMLGNENCPGITFLTMKELFRQIEALSDARNFDIGISYLEVYNELVMNLLTKSGPLKLREDTNGVVVSGLMLKQIHNANELLELLTLGNRNRTQHPTDANAESSRSHAIFQVHIRMVDKATGQKRTVKLSMIDLAGSERAASTRGIGLRFKEGANINKSLLALGNCINKLADGLKHIPYRDSNLTRILKDSLGGNCQTVMIANISPSSLSHDDTYNTLKYASRAKKIRTTVRQNIIPSSMPKEYLVKKANEQAEELERLKAKLAEMEKNYKSYPTSNGTTAPALDETLLNTWISRIDNCYANLRQAVEHSIAFKSKEKLLNMRMQLKEQAERIARIVTLDGSHTNEHIAKLEASIDRCGKQVAVQQSEKNNWLERLQQAQRNRNTLRQEALKSELGSVLKVYLNGKDAEIAAAKANLCKEHVLQISFTYSQENKLWNTIMELSGEIIQNNYLLLRSMDRLDNVMLEKLNRLVKMNQRQRGVTFIDDDCQQEQREETNVSESSVDDIANLSECSDDAVDFSSVDSNADKLMEVACGKRTQRSEESEPEQENETDRLNPHHHQLLPSVKLTSGNVEQSVFKKPKTVGRTLSFKATPAAAAGSRSTMSRRTPTKAAATKASKPILSQRLKAPRLVVTDVLPGPAQKHSSHAAGGGRPVLGAMGEDSSDTSDEQIGVGNIANTTFDIGASKDAATDSMFSNVLVESNVDPQVLDKVLRRASMKGKITLSTTKENRKKSPKRIGKSPRSINRNGSRPNATNVINRYRMIKGKEGVTGLTSGGSSSTSNGTTTATATATTSKTATASRFANNNVENDSDRNRHNRLMGIKK